MLLRSNDSLWFCFSINRFFSACICPQRPQAKGTYLPSMHLDSWDSHPRVDLTQMPPSVATAHGSATASTLALWLDISIIIPSACRGLRCELLSHRQSPEDLERLLSVDSFGCSLLWLALSDSRRKVKGMLIFNFQGSQGKADFYPLTYVKEVFLHE